VSSTSFNSLNSVIGDDAASPTITRTRILESSAPEYASEDRVVVDAVLSGDRDAFRVLVEREGPALVRASYRILGDLHEAEDVAQEAFVTAYRSLADWRGEGPFGAWLTRTAVRLAIRRASRRTRVAWLDVNQAADGSAGDPASVAVADASRAARPWSDPSALAVRAERAADVRAAVAGLSEPYREVVALRFFGELSLDEIARQLDRPLGTVKTHLHRGLNRLRASLSSEAAP
jgi:RNA polymerase sigma-70 factor, ECF subfamily